MLRSIATLRGYGVYGKDGDCGRVDDFYFDDQFWTIRHIVVSLGAWLTARRVLIAPAAFCEADWYRKKVFVTLSREQIERSPAADTQQPVSRQRQADLTADAEWLYYGVGTSEIGTVPHVPPTPVLPRDVTRAPQGDQHLRSAREVCGYHIQAHDGQLGSISDFLFDDQSWRMRFVIIRTGSWWRGHKVQIPVSRIKRVQWDTKDVVVTLNKSAIERGTKFDPSML